MANIKLSSDGQSLIIQDQDGDGKFGQSLKVDVNDVITKISEEKENISFDNDIEVEEEVSESIENNESKFDIIIENIRGSKKVIAVVVLLLVSIYGLNNIVANKPFKQVKVEIKDTTTRISDLNYNNKQQLEYQKSLRNSKNNFIDEAKIIYESKISIFDKKIEDSISKVKENERKIKQLSEKRISDSQVKQVSSLQFNKNKND